MMVELKIPITGTFQLPLGLAQLFVLELQIDLVRVEFMQQPVGVLVNAIDHFRLVAGYPRQGLLAQRL